MATIIQFRRDFEENWEFENPILAQGEPGLNLTNFELKIGDGITAWNDLEYFSSNEVEIATSQFNQEYPLVFSSGNLPGPANLLIDTSGGTYNPFTNIASIDISGNSSTTTKLKTPRTISLSGAVTGSVSFDGSSNVDIVTSSQPNAVILGTDTTGNYAASVAVSGNGLSISGSPGEGTDYTISSNATAANTPDTLVYRNEFGNFSTNSISANNITVSQKLTLDQGTILETGPIIIENVFLIDTTTSASYEKIEYTIDSFDVVEYRTAKYLVQITHGTEFHSSEVLVVHNDVSAFITEYGTVYTDVELGTLNASVVSGEVHLTINPNFTNTYVRVVRNTIKTS